MHEFKVRLLSDEQRPNVSIKLREWGYEYPLERYRWDSVLLEIGDQVSYTWFEKLTPTSFSVHMCVDPKFRGRVLTPTTIKKIISAAELLGANYLYIITQRKKVNRFAARIGFKKVRVGMQLKI